MTDKNQVFQESFLAPVQKTGKYTLLIAAVCLMFPGLFLFLMHGVTPPFGPLARAVLAV